MKTTAVFTAAILLSISAASFAQTPSVRFGIHGGASYGDMTFDADGLSVSPDSKLGFQAGFVTDISLKKHLSFQPGLNFVQKGMMFKSDENGSSYKDSYQVNNIEMPLNFLYNSRGKKGNFFAGGGPSISFAVSGKEKLEADGEETDNDLEFGDDEMEDDFRAFDFGLNAMVGYEFKAGFFVAANYNLGLRNMIPGGDSETKATWNYGGVRVGYFFNRK